MIIEDLVIEELPPSRKGSYYVGRHGPPPPVVFEISSDATWQKDLEEKPAQYASMGVSEYFAFDPNLPSFWTGNWRTYGRLVGWRKQANSVQHEEIPKDEAGRLWSEQLQSWLVMDGKLLRLYNAEGQLRLTEAEAGRQYGEYQLAERLLAGQQLEAERQLAERQLEAERERAEAERQLAERQLEAERLLAGQQLEAERERAEAERERAEAERERAEAERERAEAERERAEKLAEILRRYNLDPDNLP
jgi:hypothetical protein